MVLSILNRLENKIPPPVVMVGVAVAMWVCTINVQLIPGIGLSVFLRGGLAISVIVLGAFFCLSGVMSFRDAKTTVNPLKPDAASALVDTGIYQYSRNPMYVGFAFFLLAWALYLASFLAMVGPACFIVIMNRFQIRPEERALEGLFGSDFVQYKNKVHRWL